MNIVEPIRPSAKELILDAFENYGKNQGTIVSIVDQILIASLELSKLELAPTASGRLAVTLGKDECFEVGLPRDSVSSFRTLLARIGVICGSAAKKRSVVGKAQAFLMRTGMVADKMVTERKHPAIRYVSAVIREQPGSPLYKVDADLNVRQPNGTQTPLHVVMQNSGGELFLRIESRKAVGA